MRTACTSAAPTPRWPRCGRGWARHKIVGASCYGELQLARDAHRAGASYVAFGGFYPSRVKKYPVTTPLAIINAAKAEIPLPAVVIGGMTADNAAPLVAAGADMVAAITSVYLAPEPAGGCARIRRAIRCLTRFLSSPL